MRNDLFTNEETTKIHVEDVGIERLGSDGKYPKMKWRLPG